jgi:hypothetical protein
MDDIPPLHRPPRWYWSSCPPVNRHHRPRFSTIHRMGDDAAHHVGAGRRAAAAVVKTGPLVSEREAVTLRFVRAHTSIPVPEVYDCWRDVDSGAADPDGPAVAVAAHRHGKGQDEDQGAETAITHDGAGRSNGSDHGDGASCCSAGSSSSSLGPGAGLAPTGDYCIHMEYIEGDVLADVYDTLSDADKDAIADQLRGIVGQLRALPRARRIMAVDGRPARDPMFHGRRKRMQRNNNKVGMRDAEHHLQQQQYPVGSGGLVLGGVNVAVDANGMDIVDGYLYAGPGEDGTNDDDGEDSDGGLFSSSGDECETLTNHQQVYDCERDFRQDFAFWFLRRQNCHSAADLEAILDGLLRRVGDGNHSSSNSNSNNDTNSPTRAKTATTENNNNNNNNNNNHPYTTTALPTTPPPTASARRTQKQPQHPSAFPFTHGNLTPRNVLVRGDRVVAVLDWSQAGYYPAYWEYAKMRSCDAEAGVDGATGEPALVDAGFVRDGMPERLLGPDGDSDNDDDDEGVEEGAGRVGARLAAYRVAAEAFGAAYREIY